MLGVHTLLNLAQLRSTGHVTRMPDEQPQKKVFYGGRKAITRWQKRNATKTTLKPHLKISIFQLSPGNMLHSIEQSGVASSTKEPHNLNQRESVKLKESVKDGKQEPRIHHQTLYSPNSHALFCNRQFRAKIGLHSHQRTHTIKHKLLIFRI